MKNILIYIHGLGSIGDTSKVRAIQSAFPDIKVIAPDLPTDPIKVQKIISEIVVKELEENEYPYKLSFAGTSLGGFYATYFGEIYDAQYIAINPSCTPSESLLKYVGTAYKSWVTKEDLFITKEDIKEFKRMELRITPITGYLSNVFLAEDDDVLPPGPAKEKYKYASFLKVTPTGGHRYETEWESVLGRIKEMFRYHHLRDDLL